jgi:hypothetical protein
MVKRGQKRGPKNGQKGYFGTLRVYPLRILPGSSIPRIIDTQDPGSVQMTILDHPGPSQLGHPPGSSQLGHPPGSSQLGHSPGSSISMIYRFTMNIHTNHHKSPKITKNHPKTPKITFFHTPKTPFSEGTTFGPSGQKWYPPISLTELNTSTRRPPFPGLPRQSKTRKIVILEDIFDHFFGPTFLTPFCHFGHFGPILDLFRPRRAT